MTHVVDEIATGRQRRAGCEYGERERQQRFACPSQARL
jgi:hypothetical protein